MAQANVDPEHLQRFAGNLKRFAGDLRGQASTLQRQYQQLSDTWRDQENEKFAEEFQQMMAALERFSRVAEAQAPTLMRKAAAIQQYLEGR